MGGRKPGAEFGEVRPKNLQGRIRVAGPGGGNANGDPLNLGFDPDTLANGDIFQVTPLNAFRPGQEVLFWLTVYQGQESDPNPSDYISRVRLKPWWLRPNNEFRAPGDATWLPIDEQTFGGSALANNRAVWVPSTKMLDITEFQTPPPPAAPARSSDSIILDDIWTLDLPDFNDAAYRAAAAIGSQTWVGRRVCFLYIAHGYALGFTHQFTVVGQGTPSLRIDLSWITGTLVT